MYYETNRLVRRVPSNQEGPGSSPVSIIYVLQQDILSALLLSTQVYKWVPGRNGMSAPMWLPCKPLMIPSRTQKCQNFGSLAPLARQSDWEESCVFLESLAICFSGRNKSSWTRPYHECYEHKDIIYCTDKPCDLSTEYWGESYVSDPKIPQISARSQYSFFISFWFSGRLKKTYTFLTQSRKSAKISARSLCSLITINGFFSSFWNVSGRYKSSWIRPYNECYEQKDTLYRQTMWFTNKILRRIACFRHTHKKNGLLAIMYSFFSSFWFSGRYKKKTYVSDAKVQNFGSLALLAHNH